LGKPALRHHLGRCHPTQAAGTLMQFLKRHYEKIVLCLVLLGLAGTAAWIKIEIAQVSQGSEAAPSRARKSAPLLPIDLSADQLALAQITNPPPVILSGSHNL